MQVFIRTLGKNRIEREEIGTSDTQVGVVLVSEDGQEFTIRDGTSGLRVYVTNGRLAIEPEASNVIQVKEVD